MSSSSNLGISPVLLLAVSQSLTTTKTRDSSPSTHTCTVSQKMSETKLVKDNNNHHTGEEILEEIATNQGDRKMNAKDLVKSDAKSSLNGQNETLSDPKETFSELASSDVDMASVLTTLAAQNQVLPEDLPVFHVQAASIGDTEVKLVAGSVSSDKTDLRQSEAKAVSDTLFKNISSECSTPTQSSAIVDNTSQSVTATKVVTKPHVKQTKRSIKNVSAPKHIIKAEPVCESDDLNIDVPTKIPRLDSEPETAAVGFETPNTALNSEVVKTLLKMRLAMQGLQSNVNLNEFAEEVNQNMSQSSNDANSEAMLNVLTSLAMQNNTCKLNSDSEPVTEIINKDSGEQNRFIISYDSETGAPQVQGIIVSDGVAQVIDQSGNRLLIQSSEALSEETVVQSSQDQEDAFVTAGPPDVQTGSSVTVYTDPNSTAAARSPCPVCGDTISGFHYGIFTCESCKGFFKRTVQNKKTFLCHRQGECEINLENRKKCPACRFAKCLVMGMKLEAIRADRTRGGRSSYSSAPSSGDQKIKADMSGPVLKKKITPKLIRRPSTGPGATPGSSHLVAVLNNGEVVGEVKPFVPQILTDIMNLESLLCDDDIPPEIGGDRFNISDPSVFLTFLQLAELKLYKIVRWARNLPYFANISTDDQILLLQNCWCELLTLNMCWKSIQLHGEVIFLHGQSIDVEKAAVLGIEDMFHSLLELIDHMRRLHLDQYECAAMKVIILICPDMKGLKDADKLGEQQQRISSALETYTNTHYRQSPNKFGELVLRLSELSRISFVLKGHLVKWMPPNSTSCGLLFELLKGENMKDLG